MTVHPARIRQLNTIRDSPNGGPVVYWMNRDRRRRDNWALLHAQAEAIERRVPLLVVFCLVPTFLQATIRQYGFMLRGLEELAADLGRYDIPFHVLPGTPKETLIPWIDEIGPSLIVTDFEPLRIKERWLNDVNERLGIPFHQVDAHNVVPCWHVSQKREYAAATLRPKIHRLLPEFLHDIPDIVRHPFTSNRPHAQFDMPSLRKRLHVDETVTEVVWIQPGEKAAHAMLGGFIERLGSYALHRNDPTKAAQSGLSSYFHFGQLAPQRAALAATAAAAADPSLSESCASFIEELIVRRELADNFTFHEPRYDTTDAFHPWARATLDAHRNDVRDHIYDYETWDNAATHDQLWNAAQREMVTTGKMHGYMRMYWAKKILEWTSSPEAAMDIAIALNDRYELDGRDPNGYAGIAWSIGGVHDRPWPERPVFGTVRYMNAAGCARKFDAKAYIAAHSPTTLFG